MIKSIVAVYDACVVFPPSLRDFLVWLGITGVCRPRWSNMIHEEWIRSVLAKHPEIEIAQLNRCRNPMDSNLPNALIVGFEHLIPSISLRDQNDRHVVAAAIHAEANFIVTFNLRDFPREALAAHRLVPIHPDAFVVQLLLSDPERVRRAVQRQRASLKRPKKSVEEHLKTLTAVGLPETSSMLLPFSKLL